MSEMVPTQIKLHQKTRLLEVHFSDQTSYKLPCEYLRVYSPSAEVRAAKNRGETIVGKEQVNISSIEPVGQYAVRLVFDDGHDSGIYSWKTLKNLGENYPNYWQDYVQQLARLPTGKRRAGDTIRVLFFVGLVAEAGCENLELEPGDEIKTVEDVVNQLRQRFDSSLLQTELLTITVNKQFVKPSQRVYAGDEIALVPSGN
jgi:DUF971 family protein/molybdopterin converting factor small subunit